MPGPALIPAAIAAAGAAGRLLAGAARLFGTGARVAPSAAARTPRSAAERLRENAAELAAVRRRLGELAPHAPGGAARALGRTVTAHPPPVGTAPDAEPSEEPDRESDPRLRLSERERAEAYELIRRDHLAERALERLVGAGRAPVHVDTDRLRRYHREYPRLVAEDARLDPLAKGRGLEHNAASLVQPEAAGWRRQLLDDAIAARADLVYETTGASRRGMRQLATRLAEAGYCTELQALATPRERSLQGVAVRYAEVRHRGGDARHVPDAVHDRAYAELPGALDQVHRYAEVESLAVLRDIDHASVYEAHYPSGRVKSAVPGQTPGEALLAERERERSPAERELFDASERYRSGLGDALARRAQGAGAEGGLRGRPAATAEPEAPARPERAARREHEVCTVRELSR